MAVELASKERFRQEVSGRGGGKGLRWSVRKLSGVGPAGSAPRKQPAVRRYGFRKPLIMVVMIGQLKMVCAGHQRFTSAGAN